MISLSVDIIIPEDLKEVPHHRCPEGGKGFSADGYCLSLIVSGIVKYDPKQDVVCLAGSRSTLFNRDSFI